MLSLPQPTSSDTNATGDRPSVDLPEDSVTFSRLLEFCYPQFAPEIDDISEVHRVLKACHKYQMDVIGQLVGTQLRKWMADKPLRVYAIAYDCKAVALAKEAAYRCLSHTQLELILADAPELKLLSADAFRDLLKYHVACTNAAVRVVTIKNNRMPVLKLDTDNCWLERSHSREDCPQADLEITQDAIVYRKPRLWWLKYMTQLKEKLHEHPGGWTFTDLLVLTANSTRCAYCCERWGTQMVPFLQSLEQTLDAKIRGVTCIYFPHSQLIHPEIVGGIDVGALKK